MNLDQLMKKLQKRVDKEGVRATARFLGLAPASVHNYLKNKRSPTGEIVLLLMAKLN